MKVAPARGNHVAVLRGKLLAAIDAYKSDERRALEAQPMKRVTIAKRARYWRSIRHRKARGDG